MSTVNSVIGTKQYARPYNTPVAQERSKGTEKNKISKEKETQTSKTILQLAQQDLEKCERIAEEKESNKIINNEEIPEKNFERKSEIFFSAMDMPVKQEPQQKGLSLTRLFLSKHDQDENNPSYTNFQVASSVDNRELGNASDEKTEEVFSVPQWERFHIKEIRVKSIDAANNILIQDFKKPSSTGSVPESIVPEEDPEKSIASQLSSSRRGRSLSPPSSRIIVDDTTSLESSYTDAMKFKDYFHLLTNQIKSKDWNISLQALVNIADHSKSFDHHRLCSHMTDVHQRLIEFLRSPRSQVSRTACQIAGKLFESVKDTRRPEFDDIVELLLMKTADSNKFIRKDANLALDSMIMNISHFHTIRAISQKGPMHKNDLIRISSARLYVCIVGIAGVNVIMNNAGHDSTRQRIFMNMAGFIKDKNFKTREYGIRLFKLLRDHQNFDYYLNKIVDRSNIIEIKKIIKKY